MYRAPSTSFCLDLWKQTSKKKFWTTTVSDNHFVLRILSSGCLSEWIHAHSIATHLSNNDEFGSHSKSVHKSEYVSDSVTQWLSDCASQSVSQSDSQSVTHKHIAFTTTRMYSRVKNGKRNFVIHKGEGNLQSC